jgi:hypothetical protein
MTPKKSTSTDFDSTRHLKALKIWELAEVIKYKIYEMIEQTSQVSTK